MRSVMKHSFSNVPSANIQRSSFNRTHAHKTTFNAGLLVPFYIDEVLPGDTFSMKATLFARMSTPVFPIMDNLFMDTFFFFVPNRLIWDNWQKFMGEQDNPGDSTDYLVPQAQFSYHDGTGPNDYYNLGDYFGLPRATPAGVYINALPFRAYNLIWNEWFRDQNLQNSLIINKGDGPDNPTNSPGWWTLKRRGKRHDYFTSCLPWPQKGPGVEIPIGGGIYPVTTNSSPLISGQHPGIMYSRSDGSLFTPNLILPHNITTGMYPGAGPDSALGGYGATSDNSFQGPVYPNNLKVDVTHALSATINSLRQAFQLQKLYERDARGGTRYTEILRSHFGVVSPDARLQRPEYLGGGSHPININPVLQTSSTDSTSPQGNLAAYATTSQQTGFSKSFTEHGYVIGLLSVRADLTYQQGINRMWLRRTRYDFYWPSFAHLGEQAVTRPEIYLDHTQPFSAQSTIVFGYQERYAEYRYKPSIITGAFRSIHPQTLDAWHLSQNFSTPPVLSSTFIEENPPLSRVLAVPTQPHFIMDSFMQLRCARPMPVYSVPGLIDHF